MSVSVTLSLCRARCLASPVIFLISYQLHALEIWSQRFLVGKNMVSCGNPTTEQVQVCRPSGCPVKEE